MSILDDAIREHLELKRQHGASADELKRLEDEAFGPPARPDDDDPFAEAPTEFMSTPDLGEDSSDVDEEAPEPAATGAPEPPTSRQAPNVADLQEAPPAPPAEPAPETAEEPLAVTPPEPESEEISLTAAEPAEEEHPAMEHEVVEPPAEEPPAPEAEEPPAPEDPGPTTVERQAIAEQPTEMFDVQSELDAPEFDEEDELFDEQRLSDELDQALEGSPSPPAPPTEPAAATPPTEVHRVVEDDEQQADEAENDEPDFEGDDADEPGSEEHSVFDHEEGHEDVLEDTPDFLEESPEDDQLWFEQKPPKDFDFDD